MVSGLLAEQGKMLLAAFVFAVGLFQFGETAGLPVTFNVSYGEFLARSDLIWEWEGQKDLPTKWYQSAFVGNGALGMMIRLNETNSTRTLLFVVSSSAVWDDREKNSKFSLGNNFVYDRPRLPVGQFYLTTNGEIKSGRIRLHLSTGLVVGEVRTTRGTIQFTAFSNANYDQADVMIVDVVGSSGEELHSPDVFQWEAKLAQSTWAHRNKAYIPNPPARMEISDTVHVAIQDHLSGTAHATGFKVAQRSVSHYTLYVSISAVLPSGADRFVIDQVLHAEEMGYEKITKQHSLWWNNYYQQSFLTFSDAVTESFYWIQMYKLGSATRSDREVYDLMGPWFIDNTPWPDLHWDLNVELTYYPVFGANRLDLGKSLVKLLDKNYENLINNVPSEYRSDSAAAPSGASSLECKETCYWDHGKDCLITSPTIVGNLMWISQLYYFQYRYSMDITLAASLFKILRRAVNYYVHLQYFRDGYYHLPITFSPEYPGSRGPDTNFDLALYRWGLEVAIELAEKVLEVDEPMLGKWKDSLEHLVPYPVNENGYMVAAGVPFNISHRHFSHLFMVWPLSTIDWKKDFNLAEKSVDHWIGMASELTGFCRPVVATMSMLLGRPASLYSNVTYLLKNWILPNTFYHEGEDGECGETPPMAASALQNMAVYMWQGVIHVFAGVDDASLDHVSFMRLRTQGAYLFSGRREHGRTDWIAIEKEASSAGLLSSERLLVATDMKRPLAVLKPSDVTLSELGEQVVEIKGLQPGGHVVLYSNAWGIPAPKLVISAAPVNRARTNYWGLHRHTQIANNGITKLPADFTLRGHTQRPDTVALEVGNDFCVMVDECDVGKNASLHVQRCLSPGRTQCSVYCDACEQWWHVHKGNLVSLATGQCLQISKSLNLQLKECPVPISNNLLHPREPWPWHPQPSTIKFPANGVEFLSVNNLFL